MDNLELAVERLRTRQKKFLIDPFGGEWTADRVSALCAAIASVLEGVVWEASNRDEMTCVRIKSLKDQPYVETTALIGSRLDRRAGHSHPVRIDANEIATLLAPILGWEHEAASSAWKTIVPLLIEAEGCLPQMSLSHDPSTDTLSVELVLANQTETSQ